MMIMMMMMTLMSNILHLDKLAFNVFYSMPLMVY